MSGACILGFLGAKVDPTEGRVGLSGATGLRPSTHGLPCILRVGGMEDAFLCLL